MHFSTTFIAMAAILAMASARTVPIKSSTLKSSQPEPPESLEKEDLQHMFRNLFHVDLSMGMDGQVDLSMGLAEQVQSSMSYNFALSMSHNEPDGLDITTPLLLSQAPTPEPDSFESTKASAARGDISSGASYKSAPSMAPGVIASVTLLVAAALIVVGLLVYRHQRTRQYHASASTSGETDATGIEA